MKSSSTDMVGKSFLFGDIGAVRIGERGGQLYWRMYRFIIIIFIIIIIIIFFFFFFFFFFFSEEKESPRIA